MHEARKLIFVPPCQIPIDLTEYSLAECLNIVILYVQMSTFLMYHIQSLYNFYTRAIKEFFFVCFVLFILFEIYLISLWYLLPMNRDTFNYVQYRQKVHEHPILTSRKLVCVYFDMGMSRKICFYFRFSNVKKQDVWHFFQKFFSGTKHVGKF